jgi:heptosyltransferase I
VRAAPNLKKVLMVRLDRIGDLILTLPTDQLPGFSESDVTWLVQRGMEFIPEASAPRRKHRSLDRKFSLRGLVDLFKWLRQERFDAVFFFHAPWWVSVVCAFAGVTFRAGVRSQWHSYFFLSRGVRQKRSQALYHEAEYNRRLVQQSLGWDTDVEIKDPLRLEHKLDAHRLKNFGLEPKGYLVVHPGMAGSARNWTPTLYAEFIEEMVKTEIVVVTGSPSDQEWVESVREHTQSKSIKWLIMSQPEDWLNVLASARALVAPSTGTIHVAASLGIPVLGIYCPVKVQSPKRWAPRGARTHVIVPDVECPGHMKCLMESCARFDCMRDITVAEVQAGLLRVLK